MIRIGICDDSRAFMTQLDNYITQWNEKPHEILTEFFEDGDTLIRIHRQNPFDIILLDIVMPLFSGLEIAAELREYDKTVKIVFITSSSDYAVDSYAVKASNYLLKPLAPSKLYTCLEELISECTVTEAYLTIKNTGVTHRILLTDLEYVESQGKYIYFQLKDGRRIPSPDPLYTYENILTADGTFFKCHRSYLINLRYIKKYTHKDITTLTGAIIPISRSCYKNFETSYFSQVFRKAGEEK